jgi:hypothetical protein
MHYYGGVTILEVHRISDMVINGLIVLSERSGDTYLDSQYSNIVTFFTTDTLAEEIERVTKGMSNEEYIRETTRRFNAYKSMGGSFATHFKASDTILLKMTGLKAIVNTKH